jgi:cyanophycinase-like exopeptidase
MGLICLQGGAEFGAHCRPMDQELIAAAARVRSGPVVLVALAAAPGREYDAAGRNGVRHFSALGADALAAPDARSDDAGATAAVEAAGLVVLPGGSPGRLLHALRTTTAGQALAAFIAEGGVVMGASAGAMVLAERMLDPARGLVVDGLGHVPGHLVLPHWDGRRRPPAAAGERIHGLGIPEQSGVLVVDGVPVAGVGRSSSARLLADGSSEVLDDDRGAGRG